MPNRSPHASPTPSDRQRAIYDDEEWDDGDAHTVAHGLEYWAAPMDAIGAVLKEVLAQQRRIASIHAEWESTDAEKLPAEVDAATQRLADLKAMAVEAQQVLSELKDSRREWPRMAAWTLVLLAVPMLAFALMETSARHAPTCGGHCQSISFLQDCQAVSPMTSFVFLTTLLWLCAFIVRHKVLPAYWPRMNSAMAASLRERSVASFMKAFVRFCVLVHLLYLVQYWSISLGLRMGGAATPLTNHTDYCAGEHGTACCMLTHAACTDRATPAARALVQRLHACSCARRRPCICTRGPPHFRASSLHLKRLTQPRCAAGTALQALLADCGTPPRCVGVYICVCVCERERERESVRVRPRARVCVTNVQARVCAWRVC